MGTNKGNTGFEKPNVDEDYLMNVISGDESVQPKEASKQHTEPKEVKHREKQRTGSLKNVNYEEVFLGNRYPSGRNGKVVYIRPDYHERLLRIVQLTRDEKTTLYSYIDNILEYHFKEFGTDIVDFFNERNKPIL
ncbi:DUF3408 domain-containing protein [Flavobacterium humi]|uniref:DUF3408 domain-containing protein n=1 Tax=Flavobacterium humi TaxID=2562683 RepID=A0A4Z0L9K9_9FLAO|nr:DUF3408 domain-containing protein [Flavobacterium humi]TGD58979.1 DUF3408 domain-containing protein [Flavobacterium humi]